jgi:hypothetical protein
MEDVMAATARLTALMAVILAIAFVLSVPTAKGSGLGALVGAVGVLVLVFGLLYGVTASVTAVAVAFVIQLAIVSALPVVLAPPLWAQALLIVLVVEFATTSFAARSRHVDPIRAVVRALGIAIVVSGVVQVMALLLEGAEASGVLMRAIGVAALILAGGWVALTWRRAGLADV